MTENTAYQQVEDRLYEISQAKDFFDKFIDMMEDGFVDTDQKGNATRINQAVSDISGYTPEEFMRLSYQDYMGKETASRAYHVFNQVYRTGIGNKSFEYELICKDGSRRNVEISIVLRKDSLGNAAGFRCIVRDVTLRKKAEAELMNQRSHLEAIFQSVDDAIITVDQHLNVTDTNEAATKICGLLPEELTGDFFSIHHENCNQACRDILMETIRQKTSIRNFPVNCGRKKAPLQNVSLSCAPLLDRTGNFLGAVLVIRDITRLCDLEQKLRERCRYHQLIGNSSGMQNIYQLIETISDYEATVLITGESGTGKELVAKAIHDSGVRHYKPFVTVNCSALAEHLLESELFGHVKGAFTGAIRDHLGRFQVADTGTLLLDEIGDISPMIQLKLLRVLQEKKFERVGDIHPIQVDVRIIACTHHDLKEKVRCGLFREDLYYRLNVLEIKVPPLRDRLEDMRLLVDHFISRFENKFKIIVEDISDDIFNVLMKYSWPGNIRELEHCIERAVILCQGGRITFSHISPEIVRQTQKTSPAVKIQSAKEPQEILKILNQTDWNKAKTARLLGISRKNLYEKIRKYRIAPSKPSSM
jgi:two-component system response regulator HydG